MKIHRAAPPLDRERIGPVSIHGRPRHRVATVPAVRVEWEQVILASRDPVALGRWWREVLGWVIVDDSPIVSEIRPEPGRLPGILFVPNDRPKVDQNRLHVDLRPDAQQAEAERLIGLGASRLDVGQGDVSGVVLTDPEGNELCVLATRPASS